MKTNNELHPGDKCPWCGDTEDIYSVYRDTGTTLYHANDLKCDSKHYWKNADHPKNKLRSR